MKRRSLFSAIAAAFLPVAPVVAAPARKSVDAMILDAQAYANLRMKVAEAALSVNVTQLNAMTQKNLLSLEDEKAKHALFVKNVRAYEALAQSRIKSMNRLI